MDKCNGLTFDTLQQAIVFLELEQLDRGEEAPDRTIDICAVCQKYCDVKTPCERR